MRTVADILDEWFAEARVAGRGVGKTVRDESKFLGVSSGHYSRLKNGKSPLSEDVLEKIIKKFGKGEVERAQLKDANREQFSKYVMPRTRAGAHRAGRFLLASMTEEFSVDEIVHLFGRLSNRGSCLCIDYRDLPQATPRGAYRKMAEHAGAAISKGLSFAMFNAFGTEEAISEKQSRVTSGAMNFYDPQALVDAYSYLVRLAVAVREVYVYMKNFADEFAGGKPEGQIVLYEAEVAPSIIACGISSRLFYAEYDDEEGRHHREVYEWVVAKGSPDSRHLFIERDDISIDVNAVSQQFHPIPAYWSSNSQTLPTTDAQLEQAFRQFSHGDKKGGKVPWKIYKRR